MKSIDSKSFFAEVIRECINCHYYFLGYLELAKSRCMFDGTVKKSTDSCTFWSSNFETYKEISRLQKEGFEVV